MNIATIIVGMIVFIIFVLVLRKIIRDKKNHKCSCGCSTCGCSDVCHPNKNDKDNKKELH